MRYIKKPIPTLIAIAVFAVIGIIYLQSSQAAVNQNLVGDLNSDNIVNITDLSLLLGNWNKTASSTPTPTPTPPPPTTPPPTPPTQGGCVVPSSQKLQDQDTSDSAEKPWRRTTDEVVIYFETGKVIAEHAGYITKAAEYWSRSACLDTRATATCPTGANCLTATSVSGTSGDTDGDFTETSSSGGFRTGGRIRLFTDVLKEEGPNGRLVTTVHEFGHGIGLIHRIGAGTNKCAPVMMMACTSDQSNPEPDNIDYQNLLVIYGTKI